MSYAGKLLIAHPNLETINPFYRSVVYVLQDDKDGTQGLILNKPSDFNVAKLFNSKGYDFPLTKETIRFGGPVRGNIVVMLHSDGWYSSSTDYIRNGVALSCDDLMLEKMSMGNVPRQWRMFMGLAAWAPGQLHMEMTGRFPYTPEHSWLIADAVPSIIFDVDSP